MSDQAYRDHCAAMERGSEMLLAAIRAAREGTHPATSANPVGLPRDASISREQGRIGSLARLIPPETQDDAVLRLFSQGKSHQDIAQELGLRDYNVIRGMLTRIKNVRPSVYWRAHERHIAAKGVVR